MPLFLVFTLTLLTATPPVNVQIPISGGYATASQCEAAKTLPFTVQLVAIYEQAYASIPHTSELKCKTLLP